jgi:hypothetical protein
MSSNENVIILDPYPRDSNVVFSAEDKRRLEALGRVIWHDGSRAPDAQIDRYLPNAVACWARRICRASAWTAPRICG